jgi:mono/diheme cytochrome c family protein
MSYSVKSLAPFMTLGALLLALPGVGFAQKTYANIGKPASEQDIASLGAMVSPGGKGLPAGKGTAKEGAELYAKQCASCHGKTGEGGVADQLVMGKPGAPKKGMYSDLDRHPIGFWAYSTTVWDYINRAMPANRGGSLKPDEVYALVAFLLYQEGIIKDTDVMDQNTLPKVQMPNRPNFFPEKVVWPPNPKRPSWY